MNRTPDVELVLRDYFSDDGSSAPDHVLDVIEDRIMRQPQHRAWRISWRDSHVNSYVKPLLAVAAIVVVAVAGFAFLRPSGAAVGGSPATGTPTLSTVPATLSPAPSNLSPARSTLGATPSPIGAFGGTVRYLDSGLSVLTEVDAIASGATVTGTAVSTSLNGTHTVRLECVGRDGHNWALAGKVEKTTLPGETAGPWSRIVVKDGLPQQISIWVSTDAAPAGIDCRAFLARFPFADLGPENFIRVGSGELVPPPDVAP